MKKKVWLDIYNSVTLFVYIVTYFSPRNRWIFRKEKGGQKLYNVNSIRAIYGYRQVGAVHEHLKKHT